MQPNDTQQEDTNTQPEDITETPKVSEDKSKQNRIPDKRFTKLNQKRKAAEQRVAELEQKIKDLEAKVSNPDDLQAKYEKLKQDHKKLEAKYNNDVSEWKREKTFISNGFTSSEAVKIATMYYNEIEGEEKPSLAEWLAAVKAGDIDTPEPLKAAMRSSGLPNSNAHTKPPKVNAKTHYTREDIQRMSIKEYREHREEIRRANRRRLGLPA